MGFIKWIIGAFLIQPLIFLFIWNVLAVPMFGVEKTTFMVCMVISVILDIIVTGFKANMQD